MQFITLISDWQNDDFYTAAIKGRLYSNCSDIKVIEINNQISTFDYMQAAFVVRNAFLHFPVGTIHIIAVNTCLQKQQKPLCVTYDGHYFIGTGTSTFSLIFDEEPELIIELENDEETLQSTFPELDIFAKSASIIANGGKIESLGNKLNEGCQNFSSLPAFNPNIIFGKVIYIDSYKNLFTNITKVFFEKIGKNRPFSIEIKNNKYTIKKISKNYKDEYVSEFIAVFNSLGFLEIAQAGGNIATLLDIRIDFPVNVKFF